MAGNQETASDVGIEIKGARQHNLKNIDVTIPYGKVTVITGVSGSGKSSLAFDTIYAESQQRFFSSMSPAERSQFTLLEKPQFDQITGLPPAIAISQRNGNNNLRSTVGTSTDLYDLLRALYANIGVRHCPECGRAVVKMTMEEILKLLLNCRPGTTLAIKPFQKTDYEKTIWTCGTEEVTYEDYVDSLNLIVRTYTEEGEGAVQIRIDDGEEIVLQTTEKCYHCDRIFFEVTAGDFSFNNTESMCPLCGGLGTVIDIDPERIIKYPERSILDGASPFWGDLRKFRQSPNANWMRGQVLGLAHEMEIDLEEPWEKLPESFRIRPSMERKAEKSRFLTAIRMDAQVRSPGR